MSGASEEHPPPARIRLTSGVSGLDDVLGGGLFAGGLYLLSGGPGTGKTVLANQMCFAHARDGGRCVFITMLSESHSRMILNLHTFAFFDEGLMDRITYLSGVRVMREGGLAALADMIEDEVRRRGASLLILDGFRIGTRAAGATELEQTVFLNRLATLLEFSGCTALLCTLSPPGNVAPEHALADGLLELSNRRVEYRSVRELYVVKLRGSNCLDGSHIMEIDERGLVVHPRTESKLARDLSIPGATGERLRFDIPGLDAMLHGGLFETSTTALIGATGAGKTLLGLHFLAAGARQQERSLYFGFNESPARVVAQGDGVGLGLTALCESDWIDVIWRRPFENYIDRLVEELLDHVKRRNIRRLFIDGVEGMVRNSLFLDRMHAVFAALTNQLRAGGVTTVLSFESEIMGGHIVPSEPWSALVENTLLLRYVELRSNLHRMLAIIKLRGSDFDSSLREFRISNSGIVIEEAFESAQAVLSGMPKVDGGGRR